MVAADKLNERIRDTPGELLGGRIRESRKKAELSHDALAELVETSRQHLIKLEKGIHRPRPQMLLRIAEATGRDIDWFVRKPAGPFRVGRGGT